MRIAAREIAGEDIAAVRVAHDGELELPWCTIPACGPVAQYFAGKSHVAIAGRTELAQDCRNTANPQTVPIIGSGAPPCRAQPPPTFQGRTGYYPHVRRRGP